MGRNPSINDRGTVAFSATLAAGGSGVFVWDEGQIASVAGTSGPFSGFGDPSLNEAGTLTFFATLQAGGSGIFTVSDGQAAVIADTASGLFSGFDALPVVNDRGAVAFIATLASGGSGVFLWDGGQLVTVADTGGPFSGFGGVSLNNLGGVAFLATLDGGGSGIFTGPDPAGDRVIGTGDTLFGGTVVRLPVLSREGLNDAGQIAFYAGLPPPIGSDVPLPVIARADPAAVPEPGSLALLALGTLGLLAYGRRWKQFTRDRTSV